MPLVIRDFLLKLLIALLIPASLILLLLCSSSCTLIMNQTEGEASDVIDQVQDTAPQLKATLPVLAMADIDEEEELPCL